MNQVTNLSSPATVLTLLILFGMVNSSRADIVFTAFGANGEGGSINGQILSFGSGGEVFELDSFFNLANQDLNGPVLGSSAQLSLDSLPAGITLDFASSISDDSTDLAVQYRLTNHSGQATTAVHFFIFVDPEIDVETNTYYNEAGALTGSTGSGSADPDPDSFEIDEPGYIFGDIFDNLLLGSLDNTNAVPSSSPEDASMALGFDLGPLQPFDQAIITIVLSDDGDSIGSLALRHFDSDPLSLDTLTLSGSAYIQTVPEPSSLELLAGMLTGCLIVSGMRRWRRKSAEVRRKQESRPLGHIQLEGRHVSITQSTWTQNTETT